MDYDHAPLLIDLHGSRYDQGFAYGTEIAAKSFFFIFLIFSFLG